MPRYWGGNAQMEDKCVCVCGGGDGEEDSGLGKKNSLGVGVSMIEGLYLVTAVTKGHHVEV